jgi:hypothetical protein
MKLFQALAAKDAEKKGQKKGNKGMDPKFLIPKPEP